MFVFSLEETTITLCVVYLFLQENGLNKTIGTVDEVNRAHGTEGKVNLEKKTNRPICLFKSKMIVSTFRPNEKF